MPGMSRSRIFLGALAAALLAAGAVVAPAATAAAAAVPPALVVGREHACGVDASGGFCWGLNHQGQLGDGTTTDRMLPVAIAAPNGTRFSSLVAGATHTCGLTAGGAAYCWGSNGGGQLGDGTVTGRKVPTAVAGGLSFTVLAAGNGHTCGITTGGAAYCWGYNENGQLGVGVANEDPNPRPVAVSTTGLPAFTSLTAGDSHTCALAAGTGAYCWGDNRNGAVGNGTAHEIETTPVAVRSPDGAFVAVATTGHHTCGLTAAGKAFCWGSNNGAQLGDGTRADRSVPTAVATGLTFTALAPGLDHTCGIAATGATYCWGVNDHGQLGDGTNGDRSGLIEVAAGGRTFRSVSSGFRFSCGLATSGAAFCWGSNRWGEHGNGVRTDWNDPVRASVGSPVSALSAGSNHACGLAEGGVIRCWGGNRYGQLGDGSRTDRDTAEPVSTLHLPSGTTFSAVSSGSFNTCGLAAGDVYCWGNNEYGELGDGSRSSRTTPTAVVIDDLPPGTVFTAVAAGGSHTCALTRAGAVYCWGLNASGQLGSGDESEMWSRPRRVITAGLPEDTRFVAVTTGSGHTCALASDGVAYCWGWNVYGALGDGTTEDRRTPKAVPGPTFTALAAGSRYTCGLSTAGAAYCWGENSLGSLGDGSTTDRLVPTEVTMPAGGRFTGISAYLPTCALDAGGGLYCWGPNASGAVGDGPDRQHNVPVPVRLPAGTTVAGVAAGDDFTCAHTTAGVVWCWGLNEFGQLGAGFPWAGSEVIGFPSTPSPGDSTAPTGAFKLSTSSLWAGQSATLTLSGVSDETSPPQQISRVVGWGDGTSSTLPATQSTATKRYLKAGTYQVTLTLTDAAGNKRAQSATVTATVPGKYQLDRTAAWHGQPVRLTISAVPTGTTKIAVAWGDGYVSTLRGVGQSATHRYHHRVQGRLVAVGAVKPTVVLTNRDGATTPIPAGTVTIKRDAANPKASITKPRRPERASSWKTIRGAATDVGSGVRIVRVVPVRTAARKVYCYTAGRKWVRVSGGNTTACGVDVTVSRGAWSVTLASLATGALTVTAKATDWSDRPSATAKVTQKITRS